MPQYGPDYDLAMRLKRIEDALSRLGQNPYGQAFSATQSDGTVGWSVLQDQGNAGGTVMRFFQGPNTGIDPQTGQHPLLMYAGQVMVGGRPSDSAVIFFYPSGSESVTIGAGGTGIFDAKGNLVFTPDQAAGEGLGKPYIPMPLPRPAALSTWLNTNGTSWSLMGYSDPIMQQPTVVWTAYLLADAGTTGQVRLNINNGGVIGAVHQVTSANTPISELLTLPAGFYGQTWQVAVEGQVTSGTGSIHVQMVNMYGFQS